MKSADEIAGYFFPTMITVIFIWCVVWAISPAAPCVGPFPEYRYKIGEKAIHKASGELVRIVDDWILIGNACDKKKYAKWDIRFSDGSEIQVSWKELKQIKKDKQGDR